MELIKKILIKILMLIVLLFAVNLTYEHTLWEVDRGKYADVLDSLNLIVDSTDVLYLASSSNYFHPITDTVGYTISGFIDEQFPNLKVNSVCKGYMHAGAFYSVLKNIPKNSPIKTIVVSVNMRSFGAYWVYSDSETAYSQMELMMNTDYPLIFRRLLLSLDYYDNKSKEEREQQFVTSFKKDTIHLPQFNIKQNILDWDSTLSFTLKFVKTNRINDLNKNGFACNIVKAFAYNLDTINNIRFKQFDNIVRIAKERGWNLIFNIIPDDIDKAEIMVGKEIPYILRHNADIFKEKYKNVTIIDNLELLNAYYFYEDYPTEHYTTLGKQIVANSVAEVISEIYQNTNFIEKKYNINDNIDNKSYFISYTNYDTLSNKNPYTKAFELKSLNTFKLKTDSLTISFETNSQLNDKLFAIIEYYKDTNTYSWNSYPLSLFNNENDNIYTNKIELPDIIDTQDGIRIYLWNNGNKEFIFKNFSLDLKDE